MILMKILRMQLTTFISITLLATINPRALFKSNRQYSESNFDTSQPTSMEVEMTVLSTWDMYISFVFRIFTIIRCSLEFNCGFVQIYFQIFSHVTIHTVQRDNFETQSVPTIVIEFLTFKYGLIIISLGFQTCHLENRDFLSNTGITISLLRFTAAGICLGDQFILVIESFLLVFLVGILNGGFSNRTNLPVPPTVGLPAKILAEGESTWSLYPVRYRNG